MAKRTARAPGWYSPADAKARILRILNTGSIAYSTHVLTRLEEHDMTILDAVSILRGGVVDEAEHEHGQWRFQVRTQRMALVVTFAAEDSVFVITAWRITK